MKPVVRVVQHDGVARLVAEARDTIFPDAKDPPLTEYGTPHVFTSVVAAFMWVNAFHWNHPLRGYAVDILDLDDPERGAIDPEADL